MLQTYEDRNIVIYLILGTTTMKDGWRVTDCISVWVLYILSGDYQISRLHHSWLWTMDPGRIKTKIWQQPSWNMGCSGHWTPGCVFVPLLPGYDGAGWFVCGRWWERGPVTLMLHTEHHLTKWPCISSSAQLGSDCYCYCFGAWWWILRSQGGTVRSSDDPGNEWSLTTALQRVLCSAVLCWKLFLITRAGARRWHAC